jgi:hypothetical protein
MFSTFGVFATLDVELPLDVPSQLLEEDVGYQKRHHDASAAIV